MNTVILNCNNINECFTDSPSYFVITLNDRLKALLDQYKGKVTFEFDTKERWSYTEALNNHDTTENKVVVGAFA